MKHIAKMNTFIIATLLILINSISPAMIQMDQSGNIFSEEILLSSHLADISHGSIQDRPIIQPKSAKEIVILEQGETIPVKERSSLTASGNAGELPREVDDSQNPYLPPMQRQASCDSMASFAVTYYLATNQTAKARGWTEVANRDHQLSPQFTYPLSDESGDPVSALENSLCVLKEHGAPAWAQMPFDPNDGVTWPSKEQWRAALTNRIMGYGYITTVGKPEGLQRIKTELADGNVLAFATYMKSWDYYTDIRSIGNNTSTPMDDRFFGEKIVTRMSGDRKNGMVLTVIGYNDDIWVDINRNRTMEPNELGALKVITSRGESFANSGYIWIAYDALVDDPVNNHPCVFCNCRAAWVKAYSSPYKPKVTAEVTVETDDRQQLEIFAGVNWAQATEPCAKEHNGNLINNYTLLYQNDSTIFGKGGANPYNGTIVLDMTDYASASGFYDPINDRFKPGELTFSLGIFDKPHGSNIKVKSVLFHDEIHNKQFACDIHDDEIVDSGLKWFSCDFNVSGEAAPRADPTLNTLRAIQQGSRQMQYVNNQAGNISLKFIPDNTGNYTLSSGSKLISIEILNNANHRLYIGNTFQNGPSVIRARLKAGETYIVRLLSKESIVTSVKVNQYFQTQSDDSKLNSIQVNNGLLSPSFNPDKFEYDVVLPKDDGSVKIDAIPRDFRAIALIDGAQTNCTMKSIPESSVNLTRIDVIAENGDIQTYTLRISRPTWPPTKDATLSKIELSQGQLTKAFVPSAAKHTVTLNEYQDNVIIKPIKTDKRASLYINNVLQDRIRIDIGNGKSKTVNIKVKSQTGNISKTYTLKVVRDKSKNNKLKPLEFSAGYLNKIFKPDQSDYTLYLDEKTKEVKIKAYPEHPLARVTPSQKTIRLDTGASKKITFKVKAQSGQTRIYTITVKRDKSTESSLKSLQTTPSFIPVFSAGITEYELTLSPQTAYVTVRAVKADKNAKVYIGQSLKTSQRIKVPAGQTFTIDITVTAQAGNRRVYHIKISKP